jgi:hypothetical protein
LGGTNEIQCTPSNFSNKQAIQRGDWMGSDNGVMMKDKPNPPVIDSLHTRSIKLRTYKDWVSTELHCTSVNINFLHRLIPVQIRKSLEIVLNFVSLEKNDAIQVK